MENSIPDPEPAQSKGVRSENLRAVEPETKSLILIVDDNIQNLKYLSNLLALNEYEPAEKTGGREALQFLKEKTPDLILLDIMMPEMDGYEVCEKIRENPLTSEIPIIFLTAKTEIEDIIKGLEMGAVDYITKPFHSKEFLLRCKTQLELYQTRKKLKLSNEILRLKEERISQLNQMLSGQIEKKTEELECVREEIVQQEYKSRIADITTGTLHNVKNLLNSVLTSADIVMDNMINSKASEAFRKANQLLRENLDNIEDFIKNDPKGKKLLEYYLSIEETAHLETRYLNAELNRITEKLDAIKKIVSVQQEYGRSSPNIEEVDINETIETALMMQAEILDKNRIDVNKSLEPVPVLSLSQPKLLHLMINLIKNAKDALEDVPEDERRLIIRTTADENGTTVLFRDTGSGIAPENLNRLFSHGFTTKKHGHGYGLHSCKTYAEDMGATLTAESEGEGKGACFTLFFPETKEG